MDRRRFSPEEAEKIFAGAARRQHEAEHRHETRLTMEDLEVAAKEAGIDAAHVRAAAAEILRPSHASHVRKFLGVPVEIRKSRLLAVPAAALDWGAAVQRLRSVFGKQGIATDLGSVREWTSDASEGNMPTRVVIEPDGGGTRVTIERKTWPGVTGVLFGAATTLSVGLIIAGIWLAGTGPNPMWVPALVLTAFSILFGAVGHRFLCRDSKKTLDRFEAAMNAIEQSVDDSAVVADVKMAPPTVEEDRARIPFDEFSGELGNDAATASRRAGRSKGNQR